MKPEYRQGSEVAEKFEEAMKLLFQTPKPEIERKETRPPKATSGRKKRDKD
jgi:hypothetical protein